MLQEKFIKQLFESHQTKRILPNPALVEEFAEALLAFLFPAYSNKEMLNEEQFFVKFEKIKKQLELLVLHVEDELKAEMDEIVKLFFDQLETIYNMLLQDADSIEKGDPAATSMEEVIRTYPGFYAICIYRIAHQLYELNVPYIPRMLTEIAHTKTGIDIHPGATIGQHFFIDHGTGIVIGETTVIGDKVKIYQGVTLGAMSVKKEMAQTKRHPTIENDVIIYAGATILGGKTLIGKNSTIGGNVWLTESVEEASLVYHKAETIIKKMKNYG